MRNEICIKMTLRGMWEYSSEKEILSFMKEGYQPLDQNQKSKLSLFGFQKLISQKSNSQQFPVNYVILELDTPKAIKQKIKTGCKQTFELTQAKFWMWFTKFKHDASLNYWWMYLTPSACGIRFVLKVQSPVKNEIEYKHVVESFLRLLYKKTNGGINQIHFDILINQGWFVPTFSNFFDNREDIFTAPPIKQYSISKNQIKNKITYQADIEFGKALSLTQRKMVYQQGQRNKFIFLFACNCNRFGILESDVLAYAVSNFDLGINEIKNTVRSAYKNNPNEFAKYLNPKTK